MECTGCDDLIVSCPSLSPSTHSNVATTRTIILSICPAFPTAAQATFSAGMSEKNPSCLTSAQQVYIHVQCMDYVIEQKWVYGPEIPWDRGQGCTCSHPNAVVPRKRPFMCSLQLSLLAQQRHIFVLSSSLCTDFDYRYLFFYNLFIMSLNLYAIVYGVVPGSYAQMLYIISCAYIVNARRFKVTVPISSIEKFVGSSDF